MLTLTPNPNPTDRAASNVQRVVRGAAGRRRSLTLKDEKVKKSATESRAANNLQRVVRGAAGRRRSLKLTKEKERCVL